MGAFIAAALGCIFLCSAGFRVRGGLFAGYRYAPSDQTGRLIFALAAGLTAWLGVPWWMALATVPAWFVGATFPLFGGIDLGTRDGTFWGDVAALTARGALWVTLPALVLCWPHVTFDPPMVWSQGAPHWWALLIAGPLMPVCYWAGKQSGCRLPGLGDRDSCQTGEAIYGAMLGLGIVAAVCP